MRISRGSLTEPPPTARMPPKPSASSRASSQTCTSRPACSPTSTACSASQAGVFRFAGTVARVRERQPAPPCAIARASSSSAPSPSTPARTIRETGRSLGPLERQWKANEPSIAPTTKAPRPSSGAIDASDVTTLPRSLVARASAAPARRRSVVVASPTPTSSTRPGPSEAPSDVSPAARPATGTVVSSPVRPVARDASSAARRSTPRASPASSAPGPRSGPSSSGRTGNAHTSAPPIWCGSAGLSANSGGETWGGSAVLGTISRRRP